MAQVFRVQYRAGDAVTHESAVDVARENDIPVDDGEWGYSLSSNTDVDDMPSRGGMGGYPFFRERGTDKFSVLRPFSTVDGEVITFKFTKWSEDVPFPLTIAQTEACTCTF